MTVQRVWLVIAGVAAIILARVITSDGLLVTILAVVLWIVIGIAGCLVWQYFRLWLGRADDERL